MSARTFPALGFDPAPGDVGAVSGLAAAYGRMGTVTSDAQKLMGQAGNAAPGWTGTASDGFRAKAGEFPAPLASAAASLRDAASALEGWAADLGAMRVTADDLEARAKQAMDQLARLRAEAESAILPPDPELRRRLIETARRAIDAAQEELDAVRAAARRLLEQHAELARDVARRLKSLYDEVFPNGPPTPLDPENLRKILEWVLRENKELDDWVGDNAYAINEVSNVVDDVATYYGAVGALLEVIPPTAPIGEGFSAASTVLTAGAFVGHTAAALHGVKEARVSAGEDAVGLGLAFAGGVATGKAAKIIGDLSNGLTAGGAINSVLGKDSDFQKYWAPRNWDEARKGLTIPGYQLYNAVERAYEIGHAKDLARR